MTEHMPSDEITPDTNSSPNPAEAPTPAAGPIPSDWNPRGPRARRDALTVYDEMRAHCPVARGPSGAWTLFGHADVTAAALGHESFSNAVSRHLQVPNGLDGPGHTAFRALVERYFTRERMAALEAESERLVALGATRVERHEPAPPMTAGHLVMRDPEGNEFCLD